MSSIIRFLRGVGETTGAETTSETLPPAAPANPEARVPLTANNSSNSDAPVPDQAIDNMLHILLNFLGIRTNNDADDPDEVEEWPSDLPQPVISLTSVNERTLAVGNRRGMERRGSFSVIELKGGRLDAVVSFEFFGEEADSVNAAVKELHKRLLAARDKLWNNGFLRIAAEGTSLLEQLPAQNSWRKTANYHVLYEYHYEDTDGAESLIVRIPIDIDDDHSESTVVTGEMVRWDNQSAPAMEVHGGVRHVSFVGSLSILAFLPDSWEGVEVTMSASMGGVVYERSFVSVREFLETFNLEKEDGELKTVELDGKAYVGGFMDFPNENFPEPILLKESRDVFRISYAIPALQNGAVIYLQLHSRRTL